MPEPLKIGAVQIGMVLSIVTAEITIYTPTALGRWIRAGILPRGVARSLAPMALLATAAAIFVPAVLSPRLSFPFTALFATLAGYPCVLFCRALNICAFGRPKE